MFYKTVSIPFAEFMSASKLAIVPPHLPLTEGIVGFAALGIVLIVLSMFEDRVNTRVISGGLTLGFAIGLLLLLFKGMSLLGM